MKKWVLAGVIFVFAAYSMPLTQGQTNPNVISDVKTAIQTKEPLVGIEFQSPTIIVLKGDEESFLNLNGTMAPLWDAIDIAKHFGYSLSEITTSGVGSQGNPTRFYAIMSKP